MAIDFKKGEATIAAMKAAKAANPNATFTSADIASGNIPAPAPPSISSPSPSYSSNAPSYSVPAPSLGSQYQNVPGTNWQSTNPSNPNSAKYYADGTPVPSVSFDHTATGGSKFSGYTNPEQFNAIRSMSDNQAGLSNYLENNKGSFVSNDSIYKNVPAPGNTGWNPNAGMGDSSSRASMERYTPQSHTGQLTPNVPAPSYGGRTSGAYNPTGQALDGYGFGYNPDRPAGDFRPNRVGGYGNQQANSVPAPAAPQSMEDKIRAEVKARSDKQRAGIASAVDYTKTGLKNSYDYTRGLQKDERVLEDQSFQRNNNPFSGATDYRGAMMDRNRSIADTARDKDYNAEVGAADRRLADFDALAPEQQDAMFNELQRIERQYGLEVANQTGYFNGQRNMAGQQMDFNQADSNRKFGLDAQGQAFNQGMAQKQFGLQEQGQSFNQDMAGKQLGLQSQGQSFNQGMDSKKFDWGQQMDVAGMTGNFDPYAAQKQKMQSNSAAWLKTTDTAERQRLAAENQTIGKSIGAYQDATGEWIYPQAQRTMAGQQQDLDVLKTQIAQGNWNQKFDFEMQQWASQNKLDWANMDLNTKKALAQIAIDQQQVGINQQNANTSEANAANKPDKEPNINLNTLMDQLNNTFGQRDYTGKVTGIDPSQKTALRQAIIGMNLPDAYTDQLLSSYGLPTN